MERRIASLSGSSNAADIAERRKLEAELYEAKEGLDDTYYDHANDQRSQALDEEAKAYETALTDYVESLRTKLDEATTNMTQFMSDITNAALLNASTVKTQYESTGLALDAALVNPWINAATKVTEFGGETGLGIMNSWTTESGAFGVFATNATSLLQSPFSEGQSATNAFATTVEGAMNSVYTSIQSNVVDSVAELQKLKAEMDAIYDNTNRPNTGDTSGDNNDTPPASEPPKTPTKPKTNYLLADAKALSVQYVDSAGNIYYKLDGWSDRFVSKGSTVNRSGILYAVEGSYYYTAAEKNLKKRTSSAKSTGAKQTGTGRYGSYTTVSQYASGTLGTKKDQWAITDESWIGEEITLAAGKNGQLQYLKKGSAVMPADISANLVEWGKLDPSMLDLTNPTANINMITNAVNKPEINLSFEALVKAERIDEGTLPEVKRFVQQEINTLVKQMNYAIKGKSGR